MSTYTRQDQINVIEAYQEMLDDPDRRASAKRAARAAGCSKTTALRWLRSEGVLQSQSEAVNAMWRDKYGEKWERYVVYLRMGYSVAEVASRFDVSRQTVHTAMKRAEDINSDWSARRHRRAWDPSTPPGKKRQEWVRKMAEQDRSDMTRSEIAEEHDVSQSHLKVLLESPLNPYNAVTYDPDACYT